MEDRAKAMAGTKDKFDIHLDGGRITGPKQQLIND